MSENDKPEELSTPESSTPTAPEPEAPATPTNVPRKRHKEDFDWDEDIIGNGAFGEVKLARDKETGVQYAVKILNKNQIIQQKKKEWVEREKFLLDKLRHPNIVSLYFTFSDPDNLYFVLEYCGNGELLDHIRKHKAFDLESGRFYASEIVSALEFMHSKGIAHRDLKPENVLLSEGMHIRLVDFGTARDLGLDKSARSKSFVGTAEYVCAELLREKEAGLAADLWSLGCVIYQLFAGRPPFKAASEYLIFNLIENRTFSYPENFPEVAKDLIDQLLVLNPNERIGNRADGYAELKAHPFFEGIDWDNLSNTTPPPIKPPAVLPVFPEAEKKNEGEQKDQKDAKVAAERAEKLDNQKKSIWARFLDEEELIIENSVVIKKRGLSKTRRQLILTDKPRIFYVDPEKMVIKGEIPFSAILSVEAQDDSFFEITVTLEKKKKVQQRVYYLKELNKNAKRWVASVKKFMTNSQE